MLRIGIRALTLSLSLSLSLSLFCPHIECVCVCERERERERDSRDKTNVLNPPSMKSVETDLIFLPMYSFFRGLEKKELRYLKAGFLTISLSLTFSILANAINQNTWTKRMQRKLKPSKQSHSPTYLKRRKCQYRSQILECE